VHGFIHHPAPSAQAGPVPTGSVPSGLVLTHGAGANCQAALLVALAEAFANAGMTVLRCDLPFRQARPYGPPRPGDASHDRQGLKNAVASLRKISSGQASTRQVSARMALGGHSYGGRQATMLCAEEVDLVDELLLFSYPLHPPRKPTQLRIQHLPKLRTPALFVHGTRDPFGSLEEMESALKLIPAKTMLLPVEGAGHDLGFKGKTKRDDLPEAVLAALQVFP
jgi:predicted alpha/beta-hydrolase family hydrolase